MSFIQYEDNMSYRKEKRHNWLEGLAKVELNLKILTSRHRADAKKNNPSLILSVVDSIYAPQTYSQSWPKSMQSNTE